MSWSAEVHGSSLPGTHPEWQSGKPPINPGVDPAVLRV
jgi:hypothetical protein